MSTLVETLVKNFSEKNLEKLSDIQLRVIAEKLSSYLSHDIDFSNMKTREITDYIQKYKNYLVLLSDEDIDEIENAKQVEINVPNDENQTTETNETTNSEENLISYINLDSTNIIEDNILNYKFVIEFAPVVIKRKSKTIPTFSYKPFIITFYDNEKIKEEMAYEIYRKNFFIPNQNIIDLIKNYYDPTDVYNIKKFISQITHIYLKLGDLDPITETECGSIELGIVIENSFSGVRVPKVYYGIMNSDTNGFIPISDKICINVAKRKPFVTESDILSFISKRDTVYNAIKSNKDKQIKDETQYSINKAISFSKVITKDFSNLTNGNFTLKNTLAALSTVSKRLTDATPVTTLRKIISRELDI